MSNRRKLKCRQVNKQGTKAYLRVSYDEIKNSLMVSLQWQKMRAHFRKKMTLWQSELYFYTVLKLANVKKNVIFLFTCVKYERHLDI